MIAIVGAGVTGLSCAARLDELGVGYTLIEKDAVPGGYSRSYKKGGFVFDLAGHFLHLRSEKGRALADKYAMKFDAIERIANVQTHGRILPFPFQAHTGFLPPEANLECVLGFLDAAKKIKADKPGNFKDWILATFGAGMAEHFFFPYNSKFWKMDLSEILVDWTTWSVPRPSVEEVIRGALGMTNAGMGYNPKFLYPRKGGMGKLVEALASRESGARYGSAVKSIRSKERTLVLDSGEEIAYTTLVSTASLKALAAMTTDLDAGLKKAASRLRCMTIDCAQIGISKKSVFNAHWRYIPEKKYPFYRVGTYPGQDGGTRIFVEFSRAEGTRFPGEKKIVGRAINGLRSLGILPKGVKVDEAHAISMNPAYVVYDEHRAKYLPRILDWYRKRGIHSIGRYGGWEYSSMEDGLVNGLDIADSICRKRR